MKLNIHAVNFKLTPSIRTYLEDKVGTLDRFIVDDEKEEALRHSVIEASVEVGKISQHHQKGELFRAEVNLAIGGHIIRAEAEEWDLRVAIDKVKHELQIEITKYRNCRKSLEKKGARFFKILKNLSSASWFMKETKEIAKQPLEENSENAEK